MGGSVIYQCKNPKIGIPHDDKHIFFSFDGLVFFSATMRGDTMDCHIGAQGRNKRFLRVAVNQFCEFIFTNYAWCRKIAACVKLESVKNLCLNCGFVKIGDYKNYEVFAKWAA